jgi:hypothetical protein
MTAPGRCAGVLAALLLIVALGVATESASAQNRGVAPGGPVVAAGLFDFLGPKRWRARLAEAERRQAEAEADARAARADAARARAALAQERSLRARLRGDYAHAVAQLTTYSRDADEQRALIARLRAQLDQDTATATALHQGPHSGPARRPIAHANTAPKRATVLATHPQQAQRRPTPSPSLGWGTI